MEGKIWSTRGISAAINVVILMQITYYCTDILGLNAAVIGTLFLVSKVIDAFTDLGFGFILDKTHTRFGKARPYEWFIVFEWLFTVFMFNAPRIGATGQYIWIFIMYVMINAVCATALGGIDSVYLARSFTTTHEGWAAMIIPMGIAMAVLGILRFVFCKEIVVDEAVATTLERERGANKKNQAPIGVTGEIRILY